MATLRGALEAKRLEFTETLLSCRCAQDSASLRGYVEEYRGLPAEQIVADLRAYSHVTPADGLRYLEAFNRVRFSGEERRRLERILQDLKDLVHVPGE
jgi:hypothetical protein